jgi:hypothetical protein
VNISSDDAALDMSACRSPTEDGEPATLAVVRAVADAAGSDLIDLPPLHDSVDTDALDTDALDTDALDTDALDTLATSDGGATVQFQYGNHVVVQASGNVVVYEDDVTVGVPR